MTAPIQTARFVCKAERVRELTDTLPHMARQSPFHVVKVIELTQAQYQHYAAHLGEKAPFITANRALMGTDAHGVIRCLLITVRSRRDGMLIDAQGYDYARYQRGFFWEENGVRLYDILDRVSCWCCKNKDRKELKAIYQYLPRYWSRLKELQAQIPMPMKPYSRKGVPYGNMFDLEKVFEKEIREESSISPSKRKRRRHESTR